MPIAFRSLPFVVFTMGLLALSTAALSRAGNASSRGSFKDPRDGQVYPTVEIEGRTWFAMNLNYETAASFCYEGKKENCERYGRLYRWEDALRACPPRWHISTEYEWLAMELALGIPWVELEDVENRGSKEGGRLKIGGDIGFDTQYAGWRRSEDGVYEAKDKNAAFWTGTESKLDRAWHRDIDTGDDQIWRSPVIKPYGLSVRCVRDHDDKDGQ